MKGKYNISDFLANILSDTAKEKHIQKWTWNKYIPWGINDMSVNVEDMSDINPDRLNYLWEDPHRRKYIRISFLNRTGIYGSSFD